MYILFQGFVQESPALEPGAETGKGPCSPYTDALTSQHMLQLAGDPEAYIR